MTDTYSCSSYLSLIMLITVPLICKADICTDKCTCWSTTPGTTNYECTNKGLTSIPGPLDLLTITLSVASNNITAIPRRFFRSALRIRELNFNDNQISTIETGTFDKLMVLKELHLKNNRLTSLYHNMFRHLAALEYLDLSNNRIKDISRYAFFTLPSLITVEMQNNVVHCGCEERLIREFVEIAPQPRFLKNVICTNLGNAPLMGLAYSDFPACRPDEALFQPARSRYCHACSAVSSVQNCGNERTAQCINQNRECLKQAVCYTRIEYTNVIQVYGGCSSYANCIGWERQNKDNCRESDGHVSCYVCGTESLDNKYDRLGLMKTFDVNVITSLDKVMTNGLRDPNSIEYRGFTSNLAVQTYNHIYGLNGSYSIEFIELRETTNSNPVKVDAVFTMTISTIWFITKQQLLAGIEKTLQGKYIQGVRVLAVEATLVGSNTSGECLSETTNSAEYGTFVWPVTSQGAMSVIDCPYQLNTGTKTASRLCTTGSAGNTQWANPKIGDCPKADETSRKLQALAETDVTEANVEDVSRETNDLTDQWQTFSSTEVDYSVNIVDDILATEGSKSSAVVIDNTLEIINDILFVDENLLSQSEGNTKSSSKLVSGIDKFVEGINVDTSNYKRVTPNIAAYVTATTADEFQGLSMSFQATEQQVLTESQVSYQQSEASPPSGRSGLVLPSTLFNKLSNAQKRKITKISSTTLREPKLFKTIETPSKKNITLSNNKTVEATTTINSNVIGTSIPRVSIDNLDEPVKVTFQHHREAANPVCVFWDVGSKSWKKDGCRINSTSESYTTCHCDHLTNFALLMDVYGTGGSLSEADKMALTMISYIGCGLSLIAICLTLFTYLMFKKLRRDNPSKILMNLCLAIGFVDLVFIAGMQGYTSGSEAGCKIVAILLHYFLLAALFWMAVEAFYMYLALVKVFDAYIARFQLKSSLFGWGIPLIIVIITASINKMENYGIQPGGVCWLDRVPFFISFLAPVCLLLIFNTIIFIMVLRQIFRRSSNKLTKTDRSSTMVRLRGAISLIVLLGLTWLFGILAVDNFGVVFHYLFAIFNTLQGFFIFIFYCLLKKEAQQCWRRKLPCLKSPYEQTTSSGTNKDLKTDSTSEPTSTVKVSNTTMTSKETTFRGNWQYNS